jgi:septum site-determining protein MinC
MSAQEYASKEAQPIQLQGGLFTLLTIKVPHSGHGPVPARIDAFLTKHLASNPAFFMHQGVVMDLTEARDLTQLETLSAVADVLILHSLFPVGILGGSVVQQELARGLGLPSVTAQTQSRRSIQTGRSGSNTTVRVDRPVRGGNQVYAQGGDLVVDNIVAAGAEAIADGDVHVHGPLRGRAIAGASGDRNARIYCRRLEAELMAIAGVYLTADGVDPALRGEAVRVSLRGDALTIDKI